jgi:hypothetical protein
MTDQYAVQRDPAWANDRERASEPVLEVVPEDEELIARIAAEAAEFADKHGLTSVPTGSGRDVRSAATVHQAQEIGAWSLEYLGPGFHVQLRIARRLRQARLDGWMTPARPATVLLASLTRRPVILETRVGDTGRFEFPIAPTGACRLSFVSDDAGRPPATPPFWI